MNRTCMTCEHYHLRLCDDPCRNCYAMKNGNFSEWKNKLDPMDPEVFKSTIV